MTVKQDYIPFVHGIDEVSGLTMPRKGSLIGAQNYEIVFGQQGYRRINGYERFDGQTSPTEATYWRIPFYDGELEIEAGDTVTGPDGTFVVIRVDLQYGDWSLGNAGGELIVTLLDGDADQADQLQVEGLDAAKAGFDILEDYYNHGSIISNDLEIAVPEHVEGALIIVIARAIYSGDPAPTTLAGFTSLATTTPEYGVATRLQWMVDSDGSVTSISNGSAHTLSVHVVSGVSGIGAVAVRDLDDVGESAALPALTLEESNGSSVVMSVLLLNQDRALSDPAGMTLATENGTPENYGGGEFTSWITNDGVTAFTGKTSSWTGAAYWTAYSFEILN